MLRAAPLDLGGDVDEQRIIFADMMAAAPIPADVQTSAGTLGGIPVVNVDLAGADSGKVILYFHGGAYAIGSAASSVGLASDLARRTGTRLVSVDYRLAPEAPHPAATEDAVSAYRGLLDSGLSPSRIAIAGESAGAGLAAATLVALKNEGLPQPSSAVLMSPWADLTLAGDSITEKAPVDPALTPKASNAEPQTTSPTATRPTPSAPSTPISRACHPSSSRAAHTKSSSTTQPDSQHAPPPPTSP